MGDVFGGGGGDAGDAAKEAAQIQADYQTEALNYLKETDALPRQYREEAITELGGRAGLGDDPGARQRAIDETRDSPIYEALLQQGEDAALRTGSATGTLRGGATMADVERSSQNAFLTTYNQQQQQLNQLAGLPSLSPAIAQQTSAIGTTYAQGITAEAQADQAGGQQGIGNMFGAAQLGMQGYETFSDIRLKDDIELIGKKNGHNWYVWQWNSEAKKLGLSGFEAGYMAHEISKTVPGAIGENKGYATINMAMAGAA